jgi:SAM-dependent methyltransferase
MTYEACWAWKNPFVFAEEWIGLSACTCVAKTTANSGRMLRILTLSRGLGTLSRRLGESMKIADSGMPEEAYWNSLFNIPAIIDWLGLHAVPGPIVEIGCGYGTFTVPVAKATEFDVLSLDIDAEMITIAERNVRGARRANVKFFQRDVLSIGTGLPDSSVGMVLMFNILHFAERRLLLEEAARILADSGVVAIIHWRKDIVTPRGPTVNLRPDRAAILDSATGLELSDTGESRVLEPYHWGVKLRKAHSI